MLPDKIFNSFYADLPYLMLLSVLRVVPYINQQEIQNKITEIISSMIRIGEGVNEFDTTAIFLLIIFLSDYS